MEQQIGVIQSKFLRFGLDGVGNFDQANSGNQGSFTFASLKNAYNRVYEDTRSEITSARDELKEHLSGLGTSTPPLELDQNFTRNLNQIEQRSTGNGTNSWRDIFLRRCLAGALPGGYVPRGHDFFSAKLQRVQYGDDNPLVATYRSFLDALRASSISVAQNGPNCTTSTKPITALTPRSPWFPEMGQVWISSNTLIEIFRAVEANLAA